MCKNEKNKSWWPFIVLINSLFSKKKKNKEVRGYLFHILEKLCILLSIEPYVQPFWKGPPLSAISSVPNVTAAWSAVVVVHP